MKNKGKNIDIKEIYRKYLEGNCDEDEKRLLLNYFHASDEKVLRTLVSEALQEIDYEDTAATFAESIRLRRVSDAIRERITEDEEKKTVHPVFSLRFFWLNVAATLLLFSCLYLLYYSYGLKNEGAHPPQAVQKEAALLNIPPSGVVLMINEKALPLNKDIDGIVIQVDGITDESGKVLYSGIMDGILLELCVAKGAKSRVTLPDGTQAWVNSFSKLSFPGGFNADERQVSLLGEAYFEVTKKGKEHLAYQTPFIVTSSGQEVVVLGTKFCVKAYSDEPSTRTTLVEGSVKVRSAIDSAILSPHHESSVDGDGEVITQPADIGEALAWKADEFRFNGEDIYSVMRKIARQYDINVTYADGFTSSDRFVGVLSQREELEQLFDLLSSIGKARFRVEGKEVLVF